MKRHPFGAIFLVAIAAALGAIVMLLWNWLMPAIFGIETIDFWQALGILLLSKILFGGFGFGKHIGHAKWERHNAMHDKWLKMSDEERRVFLKRRGHFGFRHNFFNEDKPEKKEEI